MKILLILLGILWIIMGVLLVILTDATKEICRNLLKLKHLKLWAVIAFAVGLVLIFGSSAVSAPWVAVTLGILGVAKGIFFIAAPEKKTKAFIDWWLNASSSVHKSWGVVSFLIGILLLLIL